MEKLFQEYLEILMACFKFDVAVYSEKMWMYWLLCIPAFFYTMFFILKWYVLTAPMWLPIAMVARSIRFIFVGGDKKNKKSE